MSMTVKSYGPNGEYGPERVYASVAPSTDLGKALIALAIRIRELIGAPLSKEEMERYGVYAPSFTAELVANELDGIRAVDPDFAAKIAASRYVMTIMSETDGVAYASLHCNDGMIGEPTANWANGNAYAVLASLGFSLDGGGISIPAVDLVSRTPRCLRSAHLVEIAKWGIATYGPGAVVQVA